MSRHRHSLVLKEQAWVQVHSPEQVQQRQELALLLGQQLVLQPELLELGSQPVQRNLQQNQSRRARCQQQQWSLQGL